MNCFHINIRQATFLILSIIINNFNIIEMVENEQNKGFFIPDIEPQPISIDATLRCPLDMQCKELSAECLQCQLDYHCIYGETQTATCKPKKMVQCKGPQTFEKDLICRYCYQTEHWEHVCGLKGNCDAVASPPEHYIANCTVRGDVLCLGNRTFNKNVRCNWTGGYRWTTALLLSVTLGGFGADRFYLGHWQEGIGKLFSFGGLGVWTLIDVILISLHYLGPADGSLYI